MALATPGTSGDLPPVSISNPSEGARDAFAKCHVGDQYPIESVAGMAQVPSARDLFHYVPLTGREREFKVDRPAWVIQFHGDLPDRFGLMTDPVCIVMADTFGFYGVGDSKDWQGHLLATPEPPLVPADRTLPSLVP